MSDALVIVGCSIIVVLLAIAANLHWRLHKLNKLNAMRRQEAEKQYDLARQHLNQSIQIICRALLEKQVDYAEASLRISALMDQLSLNGPIREEFVAFDKLADSVSHIPILDAWKELPREQKKEYQSHIEQQENLLGDFVRDAAQRMLGRTL